MPDLLCNRPVLGERQDSRGKGSGFFSASTLVYVYLRFEKFRYEQFLEVGRLYRFSSLSSVFMVLYRY